MNNRCDICIEEQCKGAKSCHCDKCDKRDECNKRLQPTVRITTRCTQACTHCCFSCSPKADDVMSMDVARQINQFIKANGIDSMNVMGGEFFLNPNWFAILQLFNNSVDRIRLVTNGDWAGTHLGRIIVRGLSTISNLYVAISKDEWHTNEHIDIAVELLEDEDIPYIVGGIGETETFSPIVPIGRAQFDSGTFFSSFGCYCRNPEHIYSFLVDETGTIYKCLFGIWDYASVDEFQEGGFRVRFRELNRKFYRTFISNCRICVEAYRLRTFEKEHKG